MMITVVKIDTAVLFKLVLVRSIYKGNVKFVSETYRVFCFFFLLIRVSHPTDSVVFVLFSVEDFSVTLSRFDAALLRIQFLGETLVHTTVYLDFTSCLPGFLIHFASHSLNSILL